MVVVIVASAPIYSGVDPNLVAEVEELADKIGEVKDIDWERVALVGLLGIFGGGTGVNLFKNRKS